MLDYETKKLNESIAFSFKLWKKQTSSPHDSDAQYCWPPELHINSRWQQVIYFLDISVKTTEANFWSSVFFNHDSDQALLFWSSIFFWNDGNHCFQAASPCCSIHDKKQLSNRQNKFT